MCRISQQFYSCEATLLDLPVRPYRRLYLADVGFLKQEHAKTALSDATTYGIGQFTRQQGAVEW